MVEEEIFRIVKPDGSFDESSSANGQTDFLVVSDSTGWTIQNNVFYRPPHAAIQILDGGVNDFEAHHIVNNTIECVENAFLAPPLGIRSERCSSCFVTNNIIMACDISRFAGQTAELLFVGQGVFDDIQFSNQSIPEPSVVGLSVIGSLLLGWRHISKRQ